MRAIDIGKVLALVHDTLGDSLDHLSDRFSGEESDDLKHVAEFAKSWKKLSANARKTFVQQLVKSTGLVIATALATKAGMKVAWKNHKKIRRVLLAAADAIEPVAKRPRKNVKKRARKVK
ncbi:MAG TPA: hypothetical protein VMS98_06090 [Thermoanaerobaculia bacterium]|nr:hypothetical protein [Thermoanaerobaculia bacterium]